MAMTTDPSLLFLAATLAAGLFKGSSVIQYIRGWIGVVIVGQVSFRREEGRCSEIGGGGMWVRTSSCVVVE